MFVVYVLQSRVKNYIYVGLTNNLKRRLEEHDRGASKTIRSYRPFDLVHSEKIESRIEARKREKYLKSGCGKERIKRELL